MKTLMLIRRTACSSADFFGSPVYYNPRTTKNKFFFGYDPIDPPSHPPDGFPNRKRPETPTPPRYILCRDVHLHASDHPPGAYADRPRAIESLILKLYRKAP